MTQSEFAVLQKESRLLRRENTVLASKFSKISNNHQDLKSKYRNLSKEHKKLSVQYNELLAKHKEITLRYNALEEKAKTMQQRMFGKKSDKIQNKSVIKLINKKDKTQESTAKSGKGRKPIGEYVPDAEQHYDFRVNPVCCDQEMLYMGNNSSTHHDYEVNFKKIKITQGKYVCHCCNNIKVANGNKLPIPKGLPLPGLLSKVILDKFSSAVPFYRQAQNFNYANIEYSRQLLNGWFSRAADLIEPLVNLMFQKMLESAYLMCDETGLVLLDKKDGESGNVHMCVIKEASKEFNFVYVWVIESRSQKVIVEKLTKFKGYFQSDGLNFYFALQKREGIIAVGCWAHVRRYFVEVANLAGINAKPGIAHKVVEMIDELYRIEKEGKINSNNLLKLRQTIGVSTLGKLKKYLETTKDKVPPKSKISEAINYTLNRWETLSVYLNNADIEIDNNATERCIKNIVIGRKNWLFAQKKESAEKIAMLYSLIISCKFNNINPQEYLGYVLEQMPYINKHNRKELEALLPDRFNLKKRFDYEYRERLGIYENIKNKEPVVEQQMAA